MQDYQLIDPRLRAQSRRLEKRCLCSRVFQRRKLDFQRGNSLVVSRRSYVWRQNKKRKIGEAILRGEKILE